MVFILYIYAGVDFERWVIGSGEKLTMMNLFDRLLSGEKTHPEISNYWSILILEEATTDEDGMVVEKKEIRRKDLRSQEWFKEKYADSDDD